LVPSLKNIFGTGLVESAAKGRTKFMLPHEDDLALLVQRNLITRDDGEPALTEAGRSAI
jgi:hypothetical protein